MRFLILALALVTDRVFGEADFLWKRIGHPIVWFGWLINRAEVLLNKPDNSAYERRRDGFISVFVLLILSAMMGALLQALFRHLGIVGLVAEAAVVSIFLAHKSLVDHVRAVADGLRSGGLAGGRKAVAQIVGRDPEALDEAGVCRAAIESLAENFADGVIAPAFWYAVLGLPGLFAYKMLNTADSMIGHLTEKHTHFGRFAALMDDAANFIPARLTGILLSVSALVFGGLKAGSRAFSTMMRDARLHRSPNSGWPESAMAGALDVALAGPRVYRGDVANEPMLNGAGRRKAEPATIVEGLDLANATHLAVTILVLVLAVIF